MVHIILLSVDMGIQISATQTIVAYVGMLTDSRPDMEKPFLRIVTTDLRMERINSEVRMMETSTLQFIELLLRLGDAMHV